jgi:hypothetical protein
LSQCGFPEVGGFAVVALLEELSHLCERFGGGLGVAEGGEKHGKEEGGVPGEICHGHRGGFTRKQDGRQVAGLGRSLICQKTGPDEKS